MTHAIAELLPFYANGTLDARERSLVQAELATCATCAAELRDLRTLAASLQARAAAHAAPADAALARALATIDTSTSAASMQARPRIHWWNAPLRYAASIVLVASASAGAVAAWHAHEAGVARDEATATQYTVSLGSAGVDRTVLPKRATIAARASTSMAAPLLAQRASLVVDVRDGTSATAAAQRIVASASGTMVIVNPLPYVSYDPGRVQAPPPLPVHALIVVPTTRLEPVLASIGTLGAVTTRSVRGDDQRAAIDADTERLHDAREARARLTAACANDARSCGDASFTRALDSLSTVIAQLARRAAADQKATASAIVRLTLRTRTAPITRHL